VQFKGRPLVYYALRAFDQCARIRETVLVTNADMLDAMEGLVKRWRLRKVKWIVAGGEQRQDSVARGLRVLPDVGMVAIHDGVRPNLQPGDITRGLRACAKTGAVIYALPVTETVKEVADSVVKRTLPRENLVLVQTPQFFSLSLLKQAYRRALLEDFCATDDAQLVERTGHPVAVIDGWPDNIKVTTREDLKRVIGNVK
jgi:2-C-methyl-D-erythritol 4-phosphate cytidylyltransferase